MTSPTPVQPGDLLLGKYRVERVLGQGGMGLVVAARHVELHELFAIKLLLPSALGHPQAVERFVREARAAARLKSEHVAKVHDVGRLPDGAPYMVMEHLAGSDLHAHLGKQGALSVTEAATYVLQACDAVAEAHSLGIVHRDLKPANLFLVRRPNGAPCVKVLDFGISKHTAADGVELTQTHALLGSPLYMSPEQMTHSKHVDRRTDIWAMGVVLYELVTGKPPFMGDTITEVVARVLQEPHSSPSFVRAELPPALDAIIDRCLAKRPEDRFSSVEELARALQTLTAPAGSKERTLVLGAPRASSPSIPPQGSVKSAAGTSTGAAWGETASVRHQPAKRSPFLVLTAGMLLMGILAVAAWQAIPLVIPSTDLGASPVLEPMVSATEGAPDPPETAAPVASALEAPATGTATSGPEPSSAVKAVASGAPPSLRAGRPRSTIGPPAASVSAAPAITATPTTTAVSPPRKPGGGVL